MTFHFVFVDITYGYTADRPEQDAPLGGMTSAVCFLAREMVKQKIRCSFVNRIERQEERLGITSYPLEALDEVLTGHDVSAVIFCGRWIKEQVETARTKTKAPFIAWMHEACFEMWGSPPLDAFDAAVFVSLWQARVNAPFVNLRWQQAVIRNAMNPRFNEMFAPNERMLETKNTPPLVLYAGDYHRGAVHLPSILHALAVLDANFVFHAYTEAPVDNEEAQNTLSALRAIPQVQHIGKVGQTELAARMRHATILLAPNLWPETSCINLIQAMAAGMLCLTTTRAALPETAGGYAHLIPTEDNDHLYRYDQAIDPTLFAKTMAKILSIGRDYPQAVEERLQAQKDFTQKAYQWKDRVQPWVELAQKFM